MMKQRLENWVVAAMFCLWMSCILIGCGSEQMTVNYPSPTDMVEVTQEPEQDAEAEIKEPAFGTNPIVTDMFTADPAPLVICSVEREYGYLR